MDKLEGNHKKIQVDFKWNVEQATFNMFLYAMPNSFNALGFNLHKGHP